MPAKRRKRSPSPPPEPDDELRYRGAERFVLVARQPTRRICEAPAPGTPVEALLDFLLEFGFDSRVGAVCCAPVTVGRSKCLLVSLRLVAAVAGAVLPGGHAVRLSDFKSDQGLKRLETNFFPLDASPELKRLAPLRLPLIDFGATPSGEVMADIRALDAETVGNFWARREERPPMTPEAELTVVRRGQRRAASARPKPGRIRVCGAYPAFGSAVPLENIDCEALDYLLSCATKPRRIAGEHVGLGWMPAGARMRFLQEIVHDEERGFDVGTAEVAACGAVPFPEISIENGPFSLLMGAPMGGVAEWLRSTPGAQDLLLMTRGRALVGSPQCSELEFARRPQT